MRIGIAHAAGKYTVPNGSGTQLSDGSGAIHALGLRTVKLYLSSDYLADYPLQASWSSTPANLTQLAQTSQFAGELSKDWASVVLTCFTFANGSTNWWRVNPTAAKLSAEYAEIRALAEHLLSAYNGTGREFVLQNWEGDWAFMDSTVVETHVSRELVDRYVAFLGTRQRAVEDARKAVASDCRVLNAVEANRVLDAREKPHLRRIARDISERISPDVVSYSAYDSTIVEQGGWGASHAAWEQATVPAFTKALRALKAAFPGAELQVGEFGFPENEAPPGANLDSMIRVVHEICRAEGVARLIYWQVFDNENGAGGAGTYRGFWVRTPAGALTPSGQTLQALGA